MNIYDKANASQRLQESEDYKLLMACIEADIFNSFQTVKVGDEETLKNVHTLSLGFNLFKNQLAKYVQLANYEAAKSEASNDEIH